MQTVIDDTIAILRSQGLTVEETPTSQGFSAITVFLPNDTKAFFIWSKMGMGEFHFKLARFWNSGSPHSFALCNSLTDGIAKIGIFTK